MMRRKFKNLVKGCLHSAFRIGQSLGFDFLPRHFYSEIPDLRLLRQTETWRKEFSLCDVHGADLEEQMDWVKSVINSNPLSNTQAGNIHELACADNGEAGFGVIEADFLHCFIRHFKPKRIVQVGCGVSTAVCLRAAAQAGYQPQIVCVEPYPTEFLNRMEKDGRIQLMRKQLQDTTSGIIEDLDAGDLFFVDSTHALGPAGEVSRIVLEYLPRLRQGVMAHFHDILFPYDYTPDILDGALFFQHESVLLQAFLTLNGDFRIRVSFSMLHNKRQSELRKLFPNYRPAQHQDGICLTPGHFPSSLYFQRVVVQ